MTISLPLDPSIEARLVAMARAKGISTDALVRVAIDRFLADTPQHGEVLNPRDR